MEILDNNKLLLQFKIIHFNFSFWIYLKSCFFHCTLSFITWCSIFLTSCLHADKCRNGSKRFLLSCWCPQKTLFYHQQTSGVFWNLQYKQFLLYLLDLFVFSKESICLKDLCYRLRGKALEWQLCGTSINHLWTSDRKCKTMAGVLEEILAEVLPDSAVK